MKITSKTIENDHETNKGEQSAVTFTRGNTISNMFDKKYDSGSTKEKLTPSIGTKENSLKHLVDENEQRENPFYKFNIQENENES